MRIRPISFGVAVVALALTACGDAGSAVVDDGRAVVVTTVAPITNIAQNIACDRAQVIGIVPEGVNSHTFEPKPSDATTMTSADLVLVNGLNLELPTLELAERNISEDASIVLLGDRTIEPDEWIFDFSFPEADGDPNPHLWTNPLFGIRFAEIILDELATLDPEGADQYRANAEALIDQMKALDVAVREATATVDRDRRKLLTYHDSFPYFAREYDWDVIGAIQPSDFSEPSPSEVAALIDQIRDQQVPAIFGSEVFPSPVLEQIAEETGAVYVDDLRDDDLPGEVGSDEHSYMGLMVFDFVTMIETLGGDATALESVPTANICTGATYADE
jgi:ABC-type Zn uptake system ZnuABC Zn-binding protein ZnuA